MKDFWMKWRREIVRGGFLFLLVVGFGLVAFNFVRRLRDRVTGFASQIATNLPGALRNLDINIDGNFDDPGRTHGDPWRWSGKLVAGQTLKIENVNGPVTVTPATTGQAVVMVEKSWNRSDSSSVRLVTVETPTGVTICAVWPNSNGECGRSGQGVRTRVGQRHGGGNGNDVAVRFTIQLPRGIKVDASTVNGDLNIASTSGVTASTVKGDITADAGGGPVKLGTVAGDVNATVRAVGTDSASISSVSGDVTLFLPKSASLTVDGNTVSGDIATGFPLTVITPQYGPGHSVHGSVGGGAGRLKLTTVSGDITVQPIGASVRIGHRTPKPAAPAAPAVAPQPR
jgi:hypothetical protein